MLSNREPMILSILSILFTALCASAQTGGPFDLSWNTIDSGGQTFSTGGQFSLGGTIGQCDAGTMSGGAFHLDGGFWGVTVPSGTGAPPATATTAALRKIHGAMGAGDIAVNLGGGVESQNVTSEPRAGGITELRVGFDVAPGTPAGAPVTIEEQVCAVCPCMGTEAAYVPYSGSASVTGSVLGNELILSFNPGLENARTYRFTLGAEVTSVADQTIEVRSLLGDVNGDGRVNATDRSLVVSAWTAPSHYLPETDIDLSGRTNATDRSLVVSAWTSAQRCAP